MTEIQHGSVIHNKLSIINPRNLIVQHTEPDDQCDKLAVVRRRRCGFVSYHFDHLLVFVPTTVQQSFVDAPVNTTVVQGETAILQCSVANRKGAVQWTKDGFALGQFK